MKYKDLIEGTKLKKSLQSSLPPTYIMPTLQNNDAYRQYRHLIALASVRAIKDNSSHMDPESTWGENQAVVCYSPADEETLLMANNLLGIPSISISSTPSKELETRHVQSPVRKFIDIAESYVSKITELNHDNGTIAMLKLSEESASTLSDWCQRCGIECIDPTKFHCTVLYSRVPVEHLSILHEKPVNIEANVKGWKKLGKALTLELDCSKIEEIHDWMRQKGGTHDFPEYIPHLSLNYDWEHKEIPKVDLVNQPTLRFDRLKVEPINPNYSEDIDK